MPELWAGIDAGREILWATDLNRGGAALLIGVLEAHNQTLVYIPGRTVYHASRTYRGDGKTDAKDPAIIADQARMRRDLQRIRGGDQISTDLRLLISDALTSSATGPALSTDSALSCWNTSPRLKPLTTTPWSKPR